MDSLTQATLGAAVGGFMLGKTAGRRALVWGAVLGTAPDLDVLANPFLDEIEQLAVHRGISHSLFLSILAAPLFGLLIDRVHPSVTDWKRWAWLSFWVFITHIFIDACTTYGTQLFQPFSNYPVSLGAIFIIDPFYTLPLAAGVVSLLWKSRSNKRYWMNTAGLAISSIYLLAGMAIKVHVNHTFNKNYARADLEVNQSMTTPAPFSVFAWTGYARGNDGHFYTGLYSIFDRDRQIELHRIPQNRDLVEPYLDDPALARIRWFSRGYYVADNREGELIVSDLRFGRSDLWLSGEPAPLVWNYRLEFNADSSRVVGFEQYTPAFDTRTATIGKLIRRIGGE